jgi:hypothetical protein
VPLKTGDIVMLTQIESNTMEESNLSMTKEKEEIVPKFLSESKMQ